MTRRKLRMVGPVERSTRGVIASGSVFRFEGESGFDWECPTCAEVLIKGYDPDGLIKLANVAIKCRKCGTISTPEASPN